MPPEDVCGISRNFSRLSPCEGQVAYALLTRAPVADRSVTTPSLPLDLHVLSLSLAFILSQDQTLRCLSCSFVFLCHSDSQTNNLGSSRHLRSFFSLDGGLPPSSFVLSLYRIISMFSAPFPFRKAVTKVLPLFLTAKFFANFFSSFFFKNPASAPVRRPPASRQSFTTTGLFRFCGCKGTAFSLSRQTFQHLFCPFCQLFSQSPIYQRVIRTKNRRSFIKNASDSFYFQNLVHIMQVVPHSVLLSVKVKSIIFIRFDFQWNIFLYRQSIPRKSDSFLRIVCEQSHL